MRKRSVGTRSEVTCSGIAESRSRRVPNGWALVGEPTHHGTEHLKGTGFIVRLSTNLDDYAPTCVPHNKQLDAGGTWERCLQGHIRAEVGTDPRGACTQCRKDRINKHYRENRDKINAATRKRRAQRMEQR